MNIKEEMEKEELKKIETAETWDDIEGEREAITLKIFKFLQPGDRIFGTLQELTTVPTQYNDKSPFAKIKINDGIYGIFLSDDLVRNLTADLIGETLEIIYIEMKKTNMGRNFKKFNIFRIHQAKTDISKDNRSDLEIF